MPTLFQNAPPTQPEVTPSRKRWNRDECAELDACGVFKQERLELVDGELISKMGKNRPHVNAFMLMLFWLVETFGKEYVNAEAPIDVSAADNSANEPEPDLIVLNRKCASIVSGNPQAAEISLLVEISDSTLNFDLTVKAALYARAGIGEYWVLDVGGRRVICHRGPADGRYSDVMVYAEREQVAPLAAPEVWFCAAIAFGD